MNILKRIDGSVIEESEDSIKQMCERNTAELWKADLWGAEINQTQAADLLKAIGVEVK